MDIKIQLRKRKQKSEECLGSEVNNAVNSNMR